MKLEEIGKLDLFGGEGDATVFFAETLLVEITVNITPLGIQCVVLI